MSRTLETIDCFCLLSVLFLRALTEVLGCRNHQTCMKEAVLLDYYACGFWWVMEANFTPEKASFTMTVLHMLLDNIRGWEGSEREMMTSTDQKQTYNAEF